jgi:hypothetical protein
MFLKLTRNFDDLPIYVNPELISGITPNGDGSCIWCCDTEKDPFEVKESPKTIVNRINAMNGIFDMEDLQNDFC